VLAPADDGRMESSTAIPPASPGRRHHRPFSAERRGIDLSTGSVLAVMVAMTVLTYLLTWVSSSDVGLTAGWLLAGEVLKLGFWLCVLGVLGSWRTSGLVRSQGSSGIVFPLAALSSATALLVAGEPGMAAGAATVLPLVVAIFLGAVREEVAFRGFLLHRLTERLGARSAVLVTSVFFAAYHLPRYLREHRSPAEMAAMLVVAYGVGVFLCRVRIETGSIWLPAIIHGLWNLLADVGHWTFPQGQLPGAYVALHTAPFALGIVMALLLVVPGGLGGVGDLRGFAGPERSGPSGVAALRRRSSR
jgi:membrane protease YdiL (CAAX protease family)